MPENVINTYCDEFFGPALDLSDTCEVCNGPVNHFENVALCCDCIDPATAQGEYFDPTLDSMSKVSLQGEYYSK